MFEQIAKNLVLRKLRKIERGALTIEFPDGKCETFGDPKSSDQVEIKLFNNKLFLQTLKSGQIGFGDSYCAGDWISDDLPAVLRLLLNNYHCLAEEKINLLKPFRWLETLAHALRPNTRTGSRQNIEAHYDLSNKFFALWLDPSMTYSSAIFRSLNETLEQAQDNKIRTILEKARLAPGQKLLEIGSGWGSLLLKAATDYACDVTSLTLSTEQKTLADQRIASAKLGHTARVLLKDYRSLKGRYDRIVSVEMLEAVGKGYLPVFFETCDKLLTDDGILVLQVITYPDQYYSEYCYRSDWIQKRIFPGSHLPSISELLRVATKHTSFMVESMENIGPHYARTLKLWRESFLQQLDAIRDLGYDENFIRSWDFYLASCQAEFETRWLADMQIVFTRANNQHLMRNFESQLRPTHLQVLEGGKKTGNFS